MSYTSKYKKYFLAYDRARNSFFWKSAKWKAFYRMYLDWKEVSMKILEIDYKNNRKSKKTCEKIKK